MGERKPCFAALWIVVLLAFSVLPALVDVSEPVLDSDHPLGGAALSSVGDFTVPAQVDALAAWDSGACLNLVDQGLLCWGHPDGATGNHSSFPLPSILATDIEMTAIAAGGKTACAIDDVGGVHCWGNNSAGQAGQYRTPYSGSEWLSDPTLVPLAESAATVGVSVGMSCALLDTGFVSCWGSDVQWGVDPIHEFDGYDPYPFQVIRQIPLPGGHSAVALGAGFGRTVCAGLDDGRISCWGGNLLGVGYDRTGTVSSDMAWAEVPVEPAHVYVDIVMAERQGCALRDDGLIACWGRDATPALASESFRERPLPDGVHATELVSGVDIVCALTDDGGAYCWGRDRYALTNQYGVDIALPKRMMIGPQDLELIDLSIGNHSACAVYSDGTAACWGQHLFGQTGNGWSVGQEVLTGFVELTLPDAPRLLGSPSMLDGDGDGWTDVTEVACSTDHTLQAMVPDDQDGDKVCDRFDTDLDGDGWSTLDETQCGTVSSSSSSVPSDLDGDGICDPLDLDKDGDGRSNDLEVSCGTDPASAVDVVPDMDGDGICDAIDEDKDGDDWSNDLEVRCLTDPVDGGDEPPDVDGDTICDWLDKDMDADNFDNLYEANCSTAIDNGTYTPLDYDGDGLCDLLEEDADDDGWNRSSEVACLGYRADFDDNRTPVDTDSDGLCDSLDLDKDG
ncbi:MAG TPA: hypothetical protein QF646_06980, partial [Candidatus Poseidoniales archaeon]|nr:hypothetical protein [Candidatus Poseidoniales archaeon]